MLKPVQPLAQPGRRTLFGSVGTNNTSTPQQQQQQMQHQQATPHQQKFAASAPPCSSSVLHHDNSNSNDDASQRHQVDCDDAVVANFFTHQQRTIDAMEKSTRALIVEAHEEVLSSVRLLVDANKARLDANVHARRQIQQLQQQQVASSSSSHRAGGAPPAAVVAQPIAVSIPPLHDPTIRQREIAAPIRQSRVEAFCALYDSMIVLGNANSSGSVLSSCASATATTTPYSTSSGRSGLLAAVQLASSLIQDRAVAEEVLLTRFLHATSMMMRVKSTDSASANNNAAASSAAAAVAPLRRQREDPSSTTLQRSASASAASRAAMARASLVVVPKVVTQAIVRECCDEEESMFFHSGSNNCSSMSSNNNASRHSLLSSSSPLPLVDAVATLVQYLLNGISALSSTVAVAGSASSTSTAVSSSSSAGSAGGVVQQQTNGTTPSSSSSSSSSSSAAAAAAGAATTALVQHKSLCSRYILWMVSVAPANHAVCNLLRRGWYELAMFKPNEVATAFADALRRLERFPSKCGSSQCWPLLALLHSMSRSNDAAATAFARVYPALLSCANHCRRQQQQQQCVIATAAGPSSSVAISAPSHASAVTLLLYAVCLSRIGEKVAGVAATAVGNGSSSSNSSHNNSAVSADWVKLQAVCSKGLVQQVRAQVCGLLGVHDSELHV